MPGYSENGFGHPIYISDTLGINPDTSEIGSDIRSTVSQLQMFFKFILKIYLIQIKQQNTSKKKWNFYHKHVTTCRSTKNTKNTVQHV